MILFIHPLLIILRLLLPIKGGNVAGKNALDYFV
jgi:hypothetical protein